MVQEKKASENPTILVIDDEEVVRLLFQSLLDDEGYPSLMAETGQLGIEMLEKHQPPLALVDKNLPDVSGLDLIAEQKRLHPNTEFIMITGYASLDSAIKAMEMGAFSYLTKPFSDMDMVLDRIRAALEVNNLRQETSLLRNRLSSLPPDDLDTLEPIASSEVVSAGQGLPSAVTEQLERTISFLESHVDKRESPPSASIWARTVDMLEEEGRKLKQLLPPNDETQG